MLKPNNINLTKTMSNRRFKNGLAGFLFTVPFIIGFILFVFSPLVMYVVMSFSKLSLNDAGVMVFQNVKFKNYVNVLFTETDFLKNLLGSLSQFSIQCPAILLFSLFIAIVLNQKFKGRAAVRAIFFLPVLIYSGATLMFSNDALSNTYFELLMSDGEGKANISQYIVTVLGGTDTSGIIDIVSYLMEKITDIICASGVQILIFLAGLQAISPQLYEAASVEGCTGWECFWKITLPMISPMILVNAIYTVIDLLGNPTNSIVNKLYNLAMGDSNYGLSSAMGLVYFIIIFAILGVVFAIVNHFVFYEETV